MRKYASILRPIIEGRDKSLAGRILRGGLAPLGWLTFGVAAWRRRQYQCGKLIPEEFAVPVISAGNITAGGTGKTPMVALLAGLLLSKGYRPGIVSRGYAAHAGHNDETRMLAQTFPGMILQSAPDRNLAIREAIDRGANCIILDDGFQRLSTKRDLDLVLLDATAPFGGGRCLPAGLLREPLTALQAADILVLTHADQAGEESLCRTEQILAGYAPGIPLLRAIHHPEGLGTPAGEAVPLSRLRELPVAALAAIARPEGFVKTLASLGANVVASFPYPDHHHYTESELRRITARAIAADARALVTTAKDMVKIADLPAASRSRLPIYALGITMKIIRGEERLLAALKRVCPEIPQGEEPRC